ncbi:hypothetical protein EYF80_014797 [Liparis tanakae]|uniref:Uncharacterized protein n=1 Tax=Liparis tanakae TaxID=230148 RepID=A0A4Z2IBG5_9TELE|nr:hypothetical protein EYF80_014797 [Liparis tanakae]
MEGRNSSGNPGLECLTSVVTFFVETDEHVTGLQLHFCKLQQEGKTGEKHGKQNTLMNYRREVTEYAVRALRAPGLKEQEAHSAVGRRRLLENQQLSVLEDGGDKRDKGNTLGWVRGIRSTTEAPDTGYCNSGSTSSDWRY